MKDIYKKYPFIKEIDFFEKIIILINGEKLYLNISREFIEDMKIDYIKCYSDNKIFIKKIDELIKTSKYYLREQKLKRILNER